MNDRIMIMRLKLISTHNKGDKMFYILIKHFYYPGTFFAPENGPLLDCNDQRKEFESREDAAAYLQSRDLFNFKGSMWGCSDYICDHGEYASPIYKIRKVRT